MKIIISENLSFSTGLRGQLKAFRVNIVLPPFSREAPGSTPTLHPWVHAIATAEKTTLSSAL